MNRFLGKLTVHIGFLLDKLNKKYCIQYYLLLLIKYFLFLNLVHQHLYLIFNDVLIQIMLVDV